MGLKVKRNTDVVYLFTPEDRRRLAELEAEIEAAVSQVGPKRITDAPPLEAAAAYDEFLVGAKERATAVNITALKKDAWRAMLAAHPPRQDVKDDGGNVTESFPQDAQVGFNADTMGADLVPASVDLDQFDGDDPEAERTEFVDELSDPDFSVIYSAAVRLNTEAGPDPKWSASSWLGQMSAAMSRSAEESASASRSSSDSPERIASSSEPSG